MWGLLLWVTKNLPPSEVHARARPGLGRYSVGFCDQLDLIWEGGPVGKVGYI